MSLLSRTETYSACAMAPPAARMEPKTPVARPMSWGWMTRVTPGKVMLSTKPMEMQPRTPKAMKDAWCISLMEDKAVTNAKERQAAVMV